MKHFIFLVFKIFSISILLLMILDFAFTQVYIHSQDRGKIDYVYNSPPRNYDVVILGSSRANNHFVPQLFEEKGLITFNFGMSGGHLFEADLLLKLMVERNYKIKNVILEADLNLSNDHRAEGVSSKFLPYLHHTDAIKNHFSNEEDFNYLYYVPFYRYVLFDSQIGFRETIKTAQKEKSSLLNNEGYYPLLKNKKGSMKNNLTNLNPLTKNKYYEDIKLICAENNINFIAIMTPMCENTKGINYFEKVKKAYPEIHNYENVVVEDKYFSSCGHMNDTGARLFTNKVIKDFF
ncbi:hypothetical protein [Flavobacterium ovatum]|uniref:hypothetical protein n=1 Tax=Flavobacterium ovatum TaxID=1928857 RepID=UPI00344F7F0F